MTVKEFCLKNTQIMELCIFRDGGWVVGGTYIDHEDLFSGYISTEVREKRVKSDEWGTLTIVDKDGVRREIPAHYIDF